MSIDNKDTEGCGNLMSIDNKDTEDCGNLMSIDNKDTEDCSNLMSIDNQLQTDDGPMRARAESESESNPNTNTNPTRARAREGAADGRFDTFWAEYPRKESKKDAIKAWGKLKPSDKLFEVIIESLRKQKNSDGCDFHKSCNIMQHNKS